MLVYCQKFPSVLYRQKELHPVFPEETVRKSHPVYKRGRYRTIASIEGLYAFERFDSVDSWYGDAFSDRDHLDSRPSSLITCANCGEREATLFLDSVRVDLLTGERKKEEKITVFPGEVMILAEDEEGI